MLDWLTIHCIRAYLNGCNNLSPSTGSSGNIGGSTGGGSSGSGSSGSGNGSSGDSGDGSDNNLNNGTGLGIYIDGGLPIPTAGLADLGLATVGIPAVAALTPYAITALNDLTSAAAAVNGLRAGTPTSAGVSAVMDAINTAASGKFPLCSFGASLSFAMCSSPLGVETC